MKDEFIKLQDISDIDNIDDDVDDIELTKNAQPLFEMSNLITKNTGLSVDIWSDHKGVLGKYKHKEPRVKMGKRGQFMISVSIESKPKILVKSKGITESQLKSCQSAIEYVGKNYDLFLKHFNDIDDSFSDDDLKNALRERGYYK